MPAVTVMLMTLNEVDNIEGAIRSFPAGTKVIVYDSFSTDGTVEKARELGATVVQRKFDTWAEHQTWGAKNIDFGNPWVYYGDADERMTPELWQEICTILDNPALAPAAYRVRFKNMFMGKWLKRSSLYPTWVVRLYRPDKIRWERLVNPLPVVDGEIGRLREHFLHFTFNKGFNAWFDKHNKYSWAEAVESIRSLEGGRVPWSGLVSRNAAERRRAMKELSFRVPFRPLMRFVYMYFARLGFLDGGPGFHYCMMIAFYEYMIVLKMRELRRREKGLSL